MTPSTEHHVRIDMKRAWPCRVVLHRPGGLGDQRQVYVPLVAYRAIVHVDGAIGHAKCGGCKGSVDLRDKYCRHCGAQLRWGDHAG